MKKKARNLMAAALCLIFLFPQTVWGADINITYQTKDSAKAGEKINVEIDVTGSKPITTLGLRLAYDSDKLTYESESWSQGVKDANAMTLVSDVESNGGKVLNISMISDAGYQGSGTMVTLTFSVKGDYTEVPVELALRDITDKDMQDVKASTSVSYKKQEENNNQNSENNNNSNNENDNNNNNGNSDTSNPNNSTGGTNDNNNTGSGDNTSNQTQTGESGGTSNRVNNPTTYQTGIEIMDYKVLSLGGIFLAAGIFCLLLKRKLSR